MEEYNLLVLDDEQYAVDGIVGTIDWKSIGITSVYGCCSADEARSVMEQHEIHVAVCDIQMGGESGLDFLRWIREKNLTMKVLFLTAYAKFEYAQESVSLGAE